MSIEAMKQALEALEYAAGLISPITKGCQCQICLAHTALRQAIEQAEKCLKEWPESKADHLIVNSEIAKVLKGSVSKRKWVGFTHEELAWLNEALNLGGRFAVIEAIEAKLKEKNT